MNHKQRIEACITGGRIDRPPVALWRHFPVDDQDPVSLARSTVKFQEDYDFDFVKITPSSSFCVYDYGARDEWRGNPEGSCEYVRFPINEPVEWLSLPTLPLRTGRISQQLEAIKLIKKSLPSNTPVIQTIFDPLSQAKNLVGRDRLLMHLRKNPDELHKGLEIILQNTLDFVQGCIELGIDGIFLAIQHAQGGLLCRQELDDFVISYDLRILEACRVFWFNVAHIHGSDIYFSEISKYPVQVVNWHDQETPPSLSDAKLSFPKGAVCGGLRQWETLAHGTPEMVKEEAKKAIQATHGERFILGTGCVLPVIAPSVNILAARQSVEGGKR